MGQFTLRDFCQFFGPRGPRDATIIASKDLRFHLPNFGISRIKFEQGEATISKVKRFTLT